MKQLPIFCLLWSGLLLFACQSKTSTNPEAAPNVIFILADDLGYADLSCYGQTKYQTPHLDQMARNGVRFSQFYVAEPVCSASRAAFLTGCYPTRVGVHGAYMPWDSMGLNPDEMTLAELVKQKDYATAIFGKWHLGHFGPFFPTNQGFDSYFGLPYSNDMWPRHPQNENFNFGELPLMEDTTVLRYLPENQDSLTTWYTERAVEFIDAKKDEPFFLYLAHSMPHVPLFVSDKFRGKSGAGLYGDVIMEIDWSVGEIMAALERNDLTDNTLVIFTSDNGPWLSYGGHAGETGGFREGKGTVFEGGIRVPFIAQWPGKIPAGLEQDQPMAAIDLFPTVAEWLDAPLPNKPLDGRSAKALFTGAETSEPHHDAYYFYYKRHELHSVLSGDGKWKLYFPHTYRSLDGGTPRNDGIPIPYNYGMQMTDALYDLEGDPAEQMDQMAAFPAEVERLRQQADSGRASLGDGLQDLKGRDRRPIGRLD